MGIFAQQEQDTFNAQQAAIQRNWADTERQDAEAYDTQMSDTAVQRQVADMNAAGVNPILAAGSAASTPTSSSPSGASASTGFSSSSPLLGFVNSAISAYKVVSDAQNMSKALDTKAYDSVTNRLNSISSARQADASLFNADTNRLSHLANVDNSTKQLSILGKNADANMLSSTASARQAQNTADSLASSNPLSYAFAPIAQSAQRGVAKALKFVGSLF